MWLSPSYVLLFEGDFNFILHLVSFYLSLTVIVCHLVIFVIPFSSTKVHINLLNWSCLRHVLTAIQKKSLPCTNLCVLLVCFFEHFWPSSFLDYDTQTKTGVCIIPCSTFHVHILVQVLWTY